jgi:hypothetical protein
LRRASQLTDERYLWYRSTMAALRALKKIAANEGRGRQKVVAAPRCLRINGEDFCQQIGQIQTSFPAVRSPPSSPVLGTPRGSISNSLTSCSA